jgi:hypothetical protein
MIFRFHDIHKALEVLQRKGTRTLPGEELYRM